MSEQDNNIALKKAKILEQKHRFAQQKGDVSWKAVAKPEPIITNNPTTTTVWAPKLAENIDFHAKNLENGDFAGEKLENANFSVANLKGINLSGADLRGVDFSGADLSGANLEGADLTGANLSGAKLIGANLKRAKLKETTLTDADLTDAVFLEIDIDNLTLEELQELVEFLATYYPQKLNLAKFDLKNVSLRGVDFTGADFTGVNILELDLSECIITPEQIAQALGRVPSPEEMKKILAPKPKKKGREFFIDMTDFFFDNGIPAGVWDTRRGKGTTFEQIFSAVKRFTNAFKKDEKTAEKPQEKTQEKEQQSSNDDLRRVIEENKKNHIEEKRKEITPPEISKPHTPKFKPRTIDNMVMHRGDNSRGI